MSVRLKPFTEVLKPDPWWDAFVMYDGKEFRKRRLEDHHAFIDGIALSDSVPANVRLLFDGARNVSAPLKCASTGSSSTTYRPVQFCGTSSNHPPLPPSLRVSDATLLRRNAS
jgi:hypothetical protein